MREEHRENIGERQTRRRGEKEIEKTRIAKTEKKKKEKESEIERLAGNGEGGDGG